MTYCFLCCLCVFSVFSGTHLLTVEENHPYGVSFVYLLNPHIFGHSKNHNYKLQNFYIVLYKLCKSYGTPYNKHNLQCITPYFKVFVMVVY